MSIVDWIFVAGIALTIVTLLLSCFFLVSVLRVQKKIKRLPTKRIKNKKKRQALARRRAKLIKKRKKNVITCLLLLFLAGALGGGASYVSYYQAMNLTTDDSDAVVKGYYLLRDFEDQLVIAKEQGDEEEKVQKNIRYLSSVMASYGIKKASEVNSTEGQLILNRYYNSLKQLGTNTSSQTKNFYANEEIVNTFLEDAKKVKNYEKEVLVYYKVDESSLIE